MINNPSNVSLLSFYEFLVLVLLVSSTYFILIGKDGYQVAKPVKPEGELKSSFELIMGIGVVSYTIAVIAGKDILSKTYYYFKDPATQTATKGDVQALSNDLMASLIESNNAILQSQTNMQALFLLTTTITTAMLFVCLIGAWQLYKRQAFLLSIMQSMQEARNREVEVPVRAVSSKQSRQSIPSNAYERWLQAELSKVNKESQHMESSIFGLFAGATALASKVFSYKATIGLIGVFFGAAGTTWYAAEALKDLPATNKKVDLLFEELTEIRKAIKASVHVSTETIKEHELINTALKNFADVYDKNSKLLYENLTAQFSTNLDAYSTALMNTMNKLNNNFMNTANVLQTYMKSIDDRLKALATDITQMKARADVTDKKNDDNDPDSFAGAVPASNGIPAATDPLIKSNLIGSMKEGKEEEGVEQIAERLLNPEVVVTSNTERLIEANAAIQQQEPVLVNAVTTSQNSMEVEREEASFFELEELDPFLVEGVATAIDTTVGLPVSSALVAATQFVGRDLEVPSNAMEMTSKAVSFPRSSSQNSFFSMSHIFQSQLDRTSIVYSGAGVTALQEQQDVLEQAVNRTSTSIPQIEAPNKYKAFVGGVIRHPFAVGVVGMGVKTGIAALGGPAVFSFLAAGTVMSYMNWFGNKFLKAHVVEPNNIPSQPTITSGLDDDE